MNVLAIYRNGEQIPVFKHPVTREEAEAFMTLAKKEHPQITYQMNPSPSPMSKSQAGRLGGLKRSPTKTESSRANGRRGGKPKIVITEPLETWRHGVLPEGTRVCGIKFNAEVWRFEFRNEDNLRTRAWSWTEPRVKRV